ncbi:MAG: HAD hydrolase-like protein [Bdellovibrionales bacterium]|nr:HAD hydrolase-like protein [Bdellovibrionales bacterium]
MSRLLMFDFDGTLVDTGSDIATAVNELLELHNKPQLPYEVIITYIGGGLDKLIEKVAPEATGNLDQIKKIEFEFLEIYERHILNNPRPLKDAEKFLDTCRHQIAIVSNKREQHLIKLLNHLGWDHFPWVSVFGGDSFDKKKPHPFPLLQTMRRANSDPESSVLVGDGIPDVDAALSCGVTSIAVTFGYAPVAELLKRGAHKQISSFSELNLLYP